MPGEINKLNELFETVLGLKTMDLDVFLMLNVDSARCTEEISKALNKDKSTIQRVLGRLVIVGIVVRKSVCLCNGKRGRFFAYVRVDDETLKQILRKKIQKKYEERIALVGEI